MSPNHEFAFRHLRAAFQGQKILSNYNMACTTILVQSNKFTSKWPRFSSRTNWKQFQRSRRWILGEKQLRGYRKKFWSILKIRGQCYIPFRSPVLPLASRLFGSLICIEYTKPTWPRAHVMAGWLCRDPNVNANVLQRFRWGKKKAWLKFAYVVTVTRYFCLRLGEKSDFRSAFEIRLLVYQYKWFASASNWNSTVSWLNFFVSL